ncbi:hypothetical protein [Deinococcus sp. UR1]|uniref:hypothetical protein n=1 Tax=Deinococcus sp. UR1 TaxID=1704277 RepID=UPI000C18EAF4|nr:hypothetical protein [Deinococcus sp. UR1]PIG96917.1 hypothetical protein AMD26_015440 [Deinococcus sp. UR1]
MTRNPLPDGPVTRQQLAGAAQLLLQDPATYAAYGAFWWSMKRLLAREYQGDARLWFAGPHDDARVRGIIERKYPTEQALYAAALHHYSQKVGWGEAYANHSYLPGRNMEPYLLTDPDMDAANAPTH